MALRYFDVDVAIFLSSQVGQSLYLWIGSDNIVIISFLVIFVYLCTAQGGKS